MAVSIRDGSLYNINRTALSTPALTNLYQVDINLDNDALIKGVSTLTGIDNDWFVRNIGISCHDATLPTSSFATAEVKDNFQGINQQFAHTRFYVDSAFSFYIDKDYRVLTFFEAWMDYISGGANVPEGDKRFYRRFRYPDTYKCNGLQITKFDKNLEKQINYQFINAFPKSIQSIPVSYGQADLLKVSVTFAYDRYIVTRKPFN
mgnify:FL=1|tara:strand:- start:90 stop:704 length:615 start_codon:yes stop_codon:yes gene_type:complete